LHGQTGKPIPQRHADESPRCRLDVYAVPLGGVGDALDCRQAHGVHAGGLADREGRPAVFDRAHADTLPLLRASARASAWSAVIKNSLTWPRATMFPASSTACSVTKVSLM